MGDRARSRSRSPPSRDRDRERGRDDRGRGRDDRGREERSREDRGRGERRRDEKDEKGRGDERDRRASEAKDKSRDMDEDREDRGKEKATSSSRPSDADRERSERGGGDRGDRGRPNNEWQRPRPSQMGQGPGDRRPSAVLKPVEPVNREKTCPLLLRIFCKVGAHHREEEFGNGRVPHNDELVMHTWLDATLKELATLIREVVEEARPKGTRLEFSVVYPTPKGQIMMKELGAIVTGRRSDNDLLALGQTRFKIGDYLDVAVYPENRRPMGNRRDY